MHIRLTKEDKGKQDSLDCLPSLRTKGHAGREVMRAYGMGIRYGREAYMMHGNKYALGYMVDRQFVAIRISYNYRLLTRQRALLQKDYKEKLEIRKIAIDN